MHGGVCICVYAWRSEGECVGVCICVYAWRSEGECVGVCMHGRG